MALEPPGRRLIPLATAGSVLLLVAALVALAPFPAAYAHLHSWEVALPVAGGALAVSGWGARQRYPVRACLLSVGGALVALVAFLGQWQVRRQLDGLHRLHAAAQAACIRGAPLEETEVFRTAGLSAWPTRYSFTCGHPVDGGHVPTTTRLEEGFDAYWQLSGEGRLQRR